MSEQQAEGVDGVQGKWWVEMGEAWAVAMKRRLSNMLHIEICERQMRSSQRQVEMSEQQTMGGDQRQGKGGAEK